MGEKERDRESERETDWFCLHKMLLLIEGKQEYHKIMAKLSKR